MNKYLISLAFLLIVFLGAYVRLTTAKTAYPAQLDAGHMVQIGIEYASGDKSVLPYYYSELQTLTAAWAYSSGMIDPGRSLQLVTLVWGVLLIPFSILFVRYLLGRWDLALFSGMMVACNQVLILYSVNGMGEMPYASLLMCGAMIMALALYRPAPWLIPVAFLPLAAALYYRDMETLISTAVFFIWTSYVSFRAKKKQYIYLGIVGVIFVAAIGQPHFRLQRENAPKAGLSWKINYLRFVGVTPGSQLQHDPDHVVWIERDKLIQELGPIPYIIQHRNLLIKSYMSNFIGGLRRFNEHIFAGSFRLGMDWFILFSLFSVLTLPRPLEYERWIVVFSLMLLFPVMASATFVNPRWLVGNVPFYLVLLSAPFVCLMNRLSFRHAKVIICIIFLIFNIRSASWAVFEHSEDPWYQYVREAGSELRKHGDESDVVVYAFPHVMIHFYESHPMRGILTPYADTLERTDELIEARGGTLIVLSTVDHTKSWPLNDLFHCTPPPSNWEFVDRLKYEWYSPKYGPQEVEYLFYRRHPLSGDE
jgi:hypothetical protein